MSADTPQSHLLGSLKTAIVLLEPDMSVSYLNSAAEALLETSDKRVFGAAIQSLFKEEGDDQVSLFESLSSNLAFTKREARLALPSGKLITVDCSVTPIFEHESISALILELQPLDRLLRISREEGILASQQNNQMLIRGLAHEIKNPLGGLRGAAQLLAKQLPTEELVEYTNIIIEEADRLSNLVDRMLRSNQLLDFQLINIHEVLERVKSLTDIEIGGKIELRRDYDPSIPEFLGDQEQLIQAVLNIVRNAMQALQQSNIPKPTIYLKTRTLRQLTIGSKRHRLVCRLDIIDNGPGIPDDILETIFYPMVSGRAEGTGLGLSISQSIINHHKGLIECGSQPGHTIFSLFIPLEQHSMEHKI